MSDHYPAQVRRQLAAARQRLADEHATSAERARIAADLRQQLADAKAELAELHAGEEPYEDERVVPTPGQWIWRWNHGTPEQRLLWAHHVIEAIDRAHTCTALAFHEQRIAEYDQHRQHERLRAEAAEARIAAIRAFADRDQDGLCCSHVQGDLRRLLDGTAEQPACPLGDPCTGVNYARRPDHGPRPSETPAPAQPAVNQCCELCPCTGAPDQAVCSPCCACGTTGSPS